MIPGNAFHSLFHDSGIEVYDLGMTKGNYSFSSISKLFRLIRKISPQCLITFNYPANIAGRIIKIFSPRVQLITSIRSSTFGSKKREILIKLTRNLDKYTVPNSSRVAENFLSKGVIDKDRLRVIPNAIALNLSKPEGLNSKANDIRNEVLGNGNDKFLWLAVGRHEIAKDYQNMINAFSNLKAAKPRPCHLMIVGSGTLTDTITDLISENNLDKDVTLISQKDDVSPYYIAADAFVSSSAWEGMPNVTVEAMQMKLPVVTTNVGEIPNIVENNKTGLIVPSKDSQLLAEAMGKVMTMSDDDRQNFGTSASQFVNTQFNIDKIVNLWQAVLN